jgi:DNA-binding NtrC family response regulator
VNRATSPTSQRTSSGANSDPDSIHLPDNLELAEAERRYARAILERCEGNHSAAARMLGISRNKLARLLKA